MDNLLLGDCCVLGFYCFQQQAFRVFRIGTKILIQSSKQWLKNTCREHFSVSEISSISRKETTHYTQPPSLYLFIGTINYFYLPSKLISKKYQNVLYIFKSLSKTNLPENSQKRSMNTITVKYIQMIPTTFCSKGVEMKSYCSIWSITGINQPATFNVNGIIARSICDDA